MMKCLKRIGGVAAGTGLIVGIALAPALAASKNGTMEISCDGVTVKTGLSIVQGSTGTFKVKQNSATESSSTKFSACSSNGNDRV